MARGPGYSASGEFGGRGRYPGGPGGEFEGRISRLVRRSSKSEGGRRNPPMRREGWRTTLRQSALRADGVLQMRCVSSQSPTQEAPQSMANAPKLLTRNDGPVAVITINRPEVRNALDNETAAALTKALRDFDRDQDLAVAVLTGADGHFCAGADLKELAAGQEYKPWAGDPDGPCHDLLSKPVIAAGGGCACAGGLGVALRCDLRVVEESATFAVLSRRWGVPMSDGTTVRLPRLIGMGRALDMLLTARKVGGAEALAIGLADRLA